MVELKNIIEDIASEILDNLDEVKSGEINKNQKKEVLAYALNRIKPMYITSNRGFTNTMVKMMNDPQFLADVMVQISVALKVIKKTIPTEVKLGDLDTTIPYYIFPKIYGKVISSKTFRPVHEAKVSLMIDGILAQPLYELWENPLCLSERDEGIFSFSPMPVEAGDKSAKREFTVKIVVEKGDNKHITAFGYDAIPAFIHNVDSDFLENVLQVEDIYVPY